VDRKNALPKDLLTAPLSAKIVWLYLRQYGTVSFSRRQLVEALGLSPVTLHQAFKFLEPHLTYQHRCIGRRLIYSLQGRETVEVESRPQALPETIRVASPSVKAVYLWRTQFGEPSCNVGCIVEALRISSKTALRVQSVIDYGEISSLSSSLINK
jgi:hypothetical protein